MAIHFTNMPSLANLAAGSLSQGIEQLATQKLGEMQQERQRQQVESGLAGIFGPGARQLSHLYTQPKLLQALVSGGIERGTQTPEGQQKSLAELYGQPYTSQATLQQKDTQEAIQRRHDERLKFEREREEAKLKHQTEAIGLGKERLDVEREKSAAAAENFAYKETKPYIQAQEAVLTESPKIIRNYQSLISAAETNPNAIISGQKKALLEYLGFEGLVGRSATDDLVKAATASTLQDRINLYRGLGSFSNREGMALERAEASSYQTIPGLIANSKVKMYDQMSKEAIARATDEIRKRNPKAPPLNIDQLAREQAAPELEKNFEASKDVYRKMGFTFPDDTLDVKPIGEFSGFDEFKKGGAGIGEDEKGNIWEWDGISDKPKLIQASGGKKK